jgi:hypothetical protein
MEFTDQLVPWNAREGLPQVYQNKKARQIQDFNRAEQKRIQHKNWVKCGPISLIRKLIYAQEPTSGSPAKKPLLQERFKNLGKC